jgi:hypothetical protein
MSDFSPSRVLLEYINPDGSSLGLVNVLALDEIGEVVATVEIGWAENAIEAENLGGKFGWTCNHGQDDWFEGNHCKLLDVFPMYAKIGIVSSEITAADAKKILHDSNIAFNEIISVTSSPEEGKTYVVASVSKPLKWSWPDPTTL